MHVRYLNANKTIFSRNKNTINNDNIKTKQFSFWINYVEFICVVVKKEEALIFYAQNPRRRETNTPWMQQWRKEMWPSLPSFKENRHCTLTTQNHWLRKPPFRFMHSEEESSLQHGGRTITQVGLRYYDKNVWLCRVRPLSCRPQ